MSIFRLMGLPDMLTKTPLTLRNFFVLQRCILPAQLMQDLSTYFYHEWNSIRYLSCLLRSLYVVYNGETRRVILNALCVGITSLNFANNCLSCSTFAQPINHWFIFIVITSLKANKGNSISYMKHLVVCLSKYKYI